MRQPCLGGSRAARECALACAPPSRGGRASWRRAQRDGVAVLDTQRLDAVVDAHLDRGLRHVLDDVAAVAAEVSLPAALGRHRGQALRAARRGRLGRAPAGRWGAGTGATPRALRAAWRCRAGCGGGRSGAAPGPVVKLAAPAGRLRGGRGPAAGRAWRTVRRAWLSGCAMIIRNLSRSTGAVHVRLTGPRGSAAPLSAARRAAGRPRSSGRAPARRARPRHQAGAARRARRGAPAPASPPEAMSLSMRPSPASPARDAA